MFALGGRVSGGRVLGTWPGLRPGDLHEGLDLKVTTDFRDVFSEALTRHMELPLSKQGGVFDGFTPAAGRHPGLFA